ncbi:MAG: PQQ-dependent sugar dehydrogenase [Planctomycetota bacterium]
MLKSLVRLPAFLFISVTVVASGAFAQGSGAALRFYGTGSGQQDRVRIRIDDNSAAADASSPCDVGAGNFTIEFWLKGSLAQNTTTNAGGDVQTSNNNWINGNIIIDRDIWGGSDADFGISIAGGFVRFGTGRGQPAINNENTIEGNIPVLDGKWHHVACVRDITTGIKQIFVDGFLDFQSSAGASTANVSYPNAGVPGQQTPWGPFLVLGAEKHDAGAAFPSFHGFFDELRIWNTARNQTQILENHDRIVVSGAPGLVGSYRFEEGVGTVVSDSSGSGSMPGVLIAGVPGNGEWVLYANNSSNTAPITTGLLPFGFQETTIVSGLSESTVIEFLPDGRMLIGERDGTIWILQNGSSTLQLLIQINASTTSGERGLTGIAVDPAFAINGHIYVFYTTLEPRDRVSRFTIVGNTANPASEFAVWNGTTLASEFHHGGCVRVGPDNKIYIATGDQFNSNYSQTLDNPFGKILRLEKNGASPHDNPLAGQPNAYTPIWAWGLRNPFRIQFDSLNGNLWAGDVGGNSFISWDEVNLITKAANYGWPNQEGKDCFIANCAAIALPKFTYQHNDPLYYYNQFQASITLGPVYRATAFPAGYQGNLFFGDYANRFIRRLIFDGAGQIVASPVFLASPNAGTIVDLKVGPDGALYYVTIGVAFTGSGDVAAVRKIYYSGAGNQPPVVAASAAPVQGAPPLLVQFNSSGTTDPDGGPSPLLYTWDFGDATTSNLPNPAHSYPIAGSYIAKLTVSDGVAAAVSVPLNITVGNPPAIQWISPQENFIYEAGTVVSFAASGSDLEDGAIPPSAFSWNINLVHAGHSHPFLGPIAGVTNGQFTIPPSGHPPEDTYYEIQCTVTDSTGLSTASVRAIQPRIAMLMIDTVPSGISIFLDGAPVTTPRLYESLVNYQHSITAPLAAATGGSHYSFQSWLDGGAASHNFTMPDGGLNQTAFYANTTRTEACGFSSYGFNTSISQTLGLIGAGNPSIGGIITLSTYGVSSAGAWTFVGFGHTELLTLGGILLVDLNQFAIGDFAPLVNGVTTLTISIPNSASLIGFVGFGQSLAFDNSLPAGIAFSNGVIITICPP